ncbi:hypothetical protein DUI87_21491 [Hirundo rustica rustica]|uniref:RNase H type-1 domain-containing protein n=1 Tax=Hirundo rustica rustica TaxID=333673 RepID=A0A3M0JN01_HIRRU|nr:hypothetical protein DUI87_21491 [Hirundo rustica rustica]
MSHVSEQEPKLVALTRALELSERKKVNIWMDSKFAFGIVCIPWGNLEGGKFVFNTWWRKEATMAKNCRCFDLFAGLSIQVVPGPEFLSLSCSDHGEEQKTQLQVCD